MHHHLTELLIALAALVFLALVVRLVIGSPGAAKNRVRILRWRIRLYLRPGPGYANILELLVRWSRLRAVRTWRPVTTLAAVVGAADPAGDRLRSPPRAGALRAARHRQHGRPDTGPRRSPDR